MKSKVLYFWKRYSYLIMLSNLLVGLIHPMVALIFFICMVGPAVTGFFTGRFWCGNLCPIGNFFDNASSRISKRIETPRMFKSLPAKLIVAAIMMSMFVYDMISAWGNGNHIGFVYFQMIMESIIIGTILSLLYSYRTWCHFCPMGSIGALVAKFSKNKKLLEVSSKCTSCRTCSVNCPMGISAVEFKQNKLSSHDCIQCGKCVVVCPKQAISYNEVESGNNLKLVKLVSPDTGSDVNLDRLLEEKLVISIIFTIPLMLLSTNMFSSHLLGTTATPEKLAIMELISTSIVILTCIDIFQIGLTSLFKLRPNIYSVITAGILSWYVYEILVVYLIISTNPAYMYRLNFLLICISAIFINAVKYLKLTGKFKLFKDV